MAYGRSRGSRILRGLALTAGLLGFAGVGAGFGVYWAFLRDLPDLRSVEDYHPALASDVFDRHGREIGEFFAERRRLVPYERVPQHVVQAFVAGEDSTFFDHAGIDYRSILRAAWVNLRGREIRQGASTITQQTVKTLLLSPERKFRRKIREMILARDLEQRFTKQEILHLYLNQIYFGHGAYGIGEAARTYFDKDVTELSVSEGALLAGLPKAPSRYSPLRSPEAAETRRRYVLERMRDERFVDTESYLAAVADQPTLVEPDASAFEAAAYFTEEVRRYLYETLGGELVRSGGLRIETTLDLPLQRAAVAAVRKGLIDLDRRQGYRGASRHVPPEGIAEALAQLAVENGIEAQNAGLGLEGAGPDSAALSWEAPSAPVDRRAPLARTRWDPPLVGIVTAVDTEAQRARVAFAPGVEAHAALDDVSWARTPDPQRAPRPVRQIERVFQIGDVARFALLPPRETEGDALVPDDTPNVELLQEPIVEGSLLSIEVESGDVLALVGGYDFERSQFNRVTQARRQPGSAFKPFIYGAALASERYTPASIVHDRPKVYVDQTSGFSWRPRNYGRKFYGPITLRKALAKSVNNATVHLADELGISNVIAYARRLGIHSPLNRDLSLALGTSGLSLLEITRAYAVFPAGGRSVKPVFIRRVLDRDGNVLLENVPLGDPLEEGGRITARAKAPGSEPLDEGPELDPDGAEVEAPDPDQLLAGGEAYLMSDMLRSVVLEGTGWRLKALLRPLAGKTGTTNDQADAWFLGFSPEIATGVWVGHDENRFLGWGETGSRAAAPIWVDYMRVALEDRPVRDFAVPDSIVFARIDRETGLLAARSSDETVFQSFLAGTEPTETADVRRSTNDALEDLRQDSFSRRMMRLDSL